MIKDKIKSLKDLKDILLTLKRDGKKIVFTNGCFDILHVGHVIYLEEAKKEGDILVAALNSDESTTRLKGRGRPIINLDERMKILAALESVDFVTSFKEDNPAGMVKELSPDVIVKGSDWKKDKIIGGDFVTKRGGRVVAIPIVKGHSTTEILAKIKKL